MRLLFATIQRQSKYDIKGESITFFSSYMYSNVPNKRGALISNRVGGRFSQKLIKEKVNKGV